MRTIRLLRWGVFLRRGVFFGLHDDCEKGMFDRKNGKKVDLAEKKIWRRWPANAARFFEIWRKSEKSFPFTNLASLN